MVIEKVHGLHATSMSLNDRFTMFVTAVPKQVPMKPRRRLSTDYNNQNFNMRNRNLIEQIARRLEIQAKRQAIKQRLGMLRRFGSESSLPGLRRSNSFSNLSQYGVKNRLSWRQSNGNLSRSASFSNLSSAGTWRGYRRRGQRGPRGRFRGGWQFSERVLRVRRNPQGTRGRGQGRGRGRGRGQARGRGQGRGGVQRNQNQKPNISKEELDKELDQYMASTKSALDKELDTYMQNAMEME